MSPRRVFEKELEELRLDVIKMGSEVERLVGEAIEAVTTQNKELAQKIIDNDDKIDAMEIEIEKKPFKYMDQTHTHTHTCLITVIQ